MAAGSVNNISGVAAASRRSPLTPVGASTLAVWATCGSTAVAAKVSAATCSGSEGILGSDAEKSGGWIMEFDFCAGNTGP